jgi:hypothetical protein
VHISIRTLVARIREAWAAADRNRHELELRIASYNTPASTAAERARLDRALEEILRRG